MKKARIRTAVGKMLVETRDMLPLCIGNRV